MEKNGTCPKTADIGGFRFLEERNVPLAIKRGAADPGGRGVARKSLFQVRSPFGCYEMAQRRWRRK
jgi:hypothetical protein